MYDKSDVVTSFIQKMRMKWLPGLLTCLCSISLVSHANAQNDGTADPMQKNSQLSLRYVPASHVYDPSIKHPFPQKVQQLLQSRLVWNGKNTGLETLVSVQCSADGRLLSAKIVRSSGDMAWDAAVMRAVQQSDPMPVDDDGRTPSQFKITFRQPR
ncbi:energy transducer TonB [Paraburkholderia sp. J76]|uniref:energy transducer TonB n=1 Tax=Paraburkholderia sp. J76 TaxID=2805439 RepID=UPI0039F51FEE